MSLHAYMQDMHGVADADNNSMPLQVAAYNLGLAQLYQHKLEAAADTFNDAITMDPSESRC